MTKAIARRRQTPNGSVARRGGLRNADGPKLDKVRGTREWMTGPNPSWFLRRGDGRPVAGAATIGAVDPKKFFFPILTLSSQGEPERLLGNAFPVTGDGGLVTCRHVISVKEGVRLVAHDRYIGRMVPIRTTIVPDDEALDLAFLPGALGRQSWVLPLLPESTLIVGHDVYTCGFYSPSGRVENMADGYFKGNVVSFRTGRYTTATLSYPAIEGLSGSPVLKYHNGVKAVGICFGSESQRVLASEIVEFREGEREYRETVNRIVEFGLAYRSEVITNFLRTEVPDATLMITADGYGGPELL
jgi:hypothetical protein